ncbi:MAG: chorismate mutase [Chloroflexi bacterium]|nr:MAG: chorismate mutase [Chloroflexota bacterium]
MNSNGRFPQNLKVCRGVRGATTVANNEPEAIYTATRELLYTMVRHNNINPEDVASAYFTTTTDINAAYPATAARQLGWLDVPLLCGHEMDVPNSLPRCVRILLHWNTSKSQQEITHVYLHEAHTLRPDQETIPPIPAEEIEMVMAQAKA